MDTPANPQRSRAQYEQHSELQRTKNPLGLLAVLRRGITATGSDLQLGPSFFNRFLAAKEE